MLELGFLAGNWWNLGVHVGRVRPAGDRSDGRVPAATTVWRLLIRIDAEELSQVLARWLRSRAAPVAAAGHWWRRVIAVDGKVARGARLADGRQVHLLSAYDTSTGIVLAQVQIAVKSNEIPAFTPLLRLVKTVLGSLDGVLIVADALHAQVGHADLLAEHGAHLMVTAKANQPTLFTQLKALPWAQVPVGRKPARPVTAVRRPVQPRHSLSRPRAGWVSPTRSRLSGSPGPARSRERPAARRRI